MEVDEEKIRERLQRIMHLEGISQAEFAKKLGRQPSNMSSILGTGKNSRNIPRGLVNDVLNAYPNINREWLMFGDGKMFKEEEMYEKMAEDVKPRLPMNVAGHCICEYLKGTKRLLCDERPIIKQFPDYDFTLVLKNNSMAPRYERGDEIAARKVDNSDYEMIEWGHDYIVDTKKEGPRFKKVYEDGDCLLLRSYDTKNYPDFRIPKSEVCAIYLVVGMIRV